MKLLLENWRKYLKEDNEKFPYQIYCDMDGVLVDFESATSKILNDLIDNPEEHQGNRKLYKAILKAKKEVGDKEITSDHFNFGSPYKKVIDLMFRALATNKDYWVEMDWLEGGKELWDFIKPYKPIILTAPVAGSDASKLGKEEWCREHLGKDIQVIVDAEKEKYAKHEGKTGLLIDDREKNVNKFKAAGGKTILYINYDSAKQQIKQIINNGENK
jgi:FMN phosphatase YigB (HAD superfamily)